MISTPRFRPRNLLVTGGAGFIGANFVHFWLGRHPTGRIVVLDALTYAGNRSSLEPREPDQRLRFVHGDIGDERLVGELLYDEMIDTIVHFAAETHVDRSIHDPDDFLRTNVIGTHALLKAARMAWLEDPRTATGEHRFHHVSTDEVYGSLGPSDPAFRETTPYAPNSPYSASKAAADHLVRAYHRTYGLSTVTSNCSNNYGPYQFPEKLIPLTLVNLLHGKPIPVYGDGQNVRDWLYVEDHCRGIELCLLDGAPGETYNFGGNKERTNVEVVRLLCATLDRWFASKPDLTRRFPDAPRSAGRPSDCLIEFVRDRPGHDRRYAVDVGKAERELGYRPVETLETGIERTIAWYLDNEPWWSSVMDGSYRRWMATNYAGSQGLDPTEPRRY
ncbi:MAG: dTDP-glucose 4,6-dehydratase [Gemmatimonas sp.]|nr:dTDP-glucose 4,6-dehydratase [Gemmatimonas sp.]